jgi:hypothetical protein
MAGMYAKKNPCKNCCAAAPNERLGYAIAECVSSQLSFLYEPRNKNSTKGAGGYLRKLFSIYHLFISHRWTNSEEYERLRNLLNGKKCFEWKDYSVPKNNPIHLDEAELRNAIGNKMRMADVILIPARVGVSNSEWVQEEINIAKTLQKPIIGIIPYRSERNSPLVAMVADEVVEWRVDQIIDAIKKLA